MIIASKLLFFQLVKISPFEDYPCMCVMFSNSVLSLSSSLLSSGWQARILFTQFSLLLLLLRRGVILVLSIVIVFLLISSVVCIRVIILIIAIAVVVILVVMVVVAMLTIVIIISRICIRGVYVGVAHLRNLVDLLRCVLLEHTCLTHLAKHLWVQEVIRVHHIS